MKPEDKELTAHIERLTAENAHLKQVLASICDSANQPEYHYQGMGCGLEDRGIIDRYEAMQYGWNEAIERVYSEVIPTLEEIGLNNIQPSNKLREFVLDVSQQIPEKPDYWTQCSQCENNISEAKNLIDELQEPDGIYRG